ncbi:MAG: bifunctional 23S rRNA (guanine(2069)-N(7))-methyltransferase RlmK/23S rRNA (guanine(2445)-N(2))-methyltransferase RlmL [Deltaproteobacteria bacterium]|nr:bifunctional 23S rRNA (guanine(2069)-N(7))-methyltransferase RlmK/23S rRNA (guanine(2445)-N(2))-methyltransferase RlmL [Deltaproteobacteria bacterium]
MPDVHAFFATAPKGLEQPLADELSTLGLGEVRAERGGVRFHGELEAGYRACLHARVANRVLLPLATFEAKDAQALYEGTKRIPWSDHLRAAQTLAVEFTSTRSAITHTHFGALKVKDAIVDQLRDRYGSRPNVQPDRPDVQVNVHLANDVATVSIDLSGESLHRRGYREDAANAPLKENLAAGILLLAGWPKVAEAGASFYDPMCGSGTLCIEAAMMAAHLPPGLQRTYWGFLGWRGHQPDVWTKVLEDAKAHVRREKLPTILGTDHDSRAIRAALSNLEKTGLPRGAVHFEKRELDVAQPPAARDEIPRGLLVTNPPYGERLGEKLELEPLYRRLGEVLRERFGGWEAWVFTGNVELSKELRLEPARKFPLFNGPIECRLLRYPLRTADERAKTAAQRDVERPQKVKEREARAAPFANRINKNVKHLRKWARRENVSCFRIYDKDLPEYAVAVDLYEQFVHVQEYAPPETVEPAKAEERLRDAISVIPDVLEVPRENVFVKTRSRQKGNTQYEKLDHTGKFHTVHEGGHKFWVNFTDYLDTGLFLDHRPTRAMVERLAMGKRFLNLFAYTGSVTVYAAAGGASMSTTVDMSNTYLDWAKRNFELNGLSKKHELVRDDVMKWLEKSRDTYDLIFLDPPTHSRSKRMDEDFDIQRDHVKLLQLTAARLAPGGTLLFSNNYRRFKLDEAALPGLAIEDISALTLPPDFARNPRIHRCWRIQKKST